MSEPRAEPRWLSAAEVAHLHGEAVKRFGGLAGTRDIGLLESAVARPRHRWVQDEGATPHDLAAVYAEAIVRNNAFVDGNKRAALLATRAFLYLNGVGFDPPEAAAVAGFEAAAAGEVELAEVAAWISDYCAPRSEDVSRESRTPAPNSCEGNRPRGSRGSRGNAGNRKG